MTTQNQPVVVAGIDGSGESLAALDLAAGEASRRNHLLRIVHAYSWPAYGTAVPMGGPITIIEPVIAAESLLTEGADRVRTSYPAVTLTTEVVIGNAAGTLVTESQTASLLVVGARGHGGFAGLLAGSVATQVSTHAHCPVIVVRPGTDTSQLAATTRPVVVGVDGIGESQAAVEFAFEEAALRGVSLTAIHAWTEPPRAGGDQFKPVGYDYDEAHCEAERTLAESVAGYSEKYPEVPVFRELVRSVNPAEQLLSASKEAGLLVVGSRGRGGFTGLLLGSASQALIHHARCAVAVARTPH
jgi:nucleotide-binding universal stress UspA family protein